MKLSWNIVLQVLALILQVYNQIGELIPEEGKPIAMFVIAVIQAVIGLVAHYKNPDGTPVTTAYARERR